MDNQCDASDCLLDNKYTQRISCRGLCGKSFHPLCLGLSKKSCPYLKEYLNYFVYLCDQCSEISLSHVLLAIKCVSDSTNSILTDNNRFHKNVLAQFHHFDDFSKSIETLECSIETLAQRFFSNLSILEKQLSSIEKTLNSRLVHSHCRFDNIKDEIRSTLTSILNSYPLDKLFDHVLNIRSTLESTLQSTSNSASSASSQLNLILLDLISKVNDINSELTVTRTSFVDIIDELKITSSKIDDIPINIQPIEVNYNTSILAEITESTLNPPLSLGPASINIASITSISTQTESPTSP